MVKILGGKSRDQALQFLQWLRLKTVNSGIKIGQVRVKVARAQWVVKELK